MLHQALVARHLYLRGDHYVVQNGKVVIVDEATGRLMPDRSWRAGFARSTATAQVVRMPSQLHRIVPATERRRPVVSVHDAASHSLAWIGSALGPRQYTLGVDRFGESGTIGDLHEIAGIDTGSIVNAALIAVSEHEPVDDEV